MRPGLISDYRALVKGTLLNEKYEIIGLLGEGGYSFTYHAIHKDIETHVAIKEFYCRDYLNRDIRFSREVQLNQQSKESQYLRDLDNFLKEARIMASLSNHEGIVNVINYFQENGTAYIVMDLLDGISLEKKLLAGYQYTWKDLVRRILPITEALASVHQRGIIHRDIKPDNIIVSKTGDFTLIDFGAALHYVGEETHSVYLSDGYAPIEQYRRTGILGPYTDIYSICAVIYRCLTGRVPTNSIARSSYDDLITPYSIQSQVQDEMEDIESDESLLNAQLPQELIEVIFKGLQIEPDKRWQNMKDFSVALRQTLPDSSNKTMSSAVIIGVIIPFVILFFVYSITQYSKLKMHILSSYGNVVEFSLEIPKEMDTEEYIHVVSIIENRVSIFAGKTGYYLEKEPTGIYIRIPSNKFILSDYVSEWNQNQLMYMLLSFNGKWLVHNSDKIKTMMLTSADIEKLELKYGCIPVESNIGEYKSMRYYHDEWHTTENYYLEMVLDDEITSFMDEYLHQKGYIFSVNPYTDSMTNYSFEWISRGDGKTVYFPIGPRSYKRIAKLMLYMMSAKPFSRPLVSVQRELGKSIDAIEWFLDFGEEYDDQITWESSGFENHLQISKNQFQEATISLISNTMSDENNERLIQLVKERLSCLEIPYAIGYDKDFDTIIVKIAAAKANHLITNSLYDGYILIVDDQDSPANLDIDYAEVNELVNNNCIDVYIKEDNTDTIASVLESQSDKLYLSLKGMRIGILDSVSQNKNLLTFKILFPEDEAYAIPRENTMEYLCSIANSSHIAISSADIIWEDKNGRLLRSRDVPDLPIGISLERFSDFFSMIENLGGKAEYIPTPYPGTINITFEHWANVNPIDSLQLIENILAEEHSNNTIPDININFDISSWFKSDVINIKSLFEPGKSTCKLGILECSDELVIDELIEYIENSDIFSELQDDEKEMSGDSEEENNWAYRIIEKDE